MSLAFAILASGSSGNSTLLCAQSEAHHCCALIDAGVSPRRTAALLAAHGRSLHDLTHLLITHFDADHFHHGWPKMIDKLTLRVVVHRRQQAPALRSGVPVRSLALLDGPEYLGERGDSPRIHALPIAHDEAGSTAFRIEHMGASLGFATDLGHIAPSLLDHFAGVQALAIESNYDPAMQLASARPPILKHRIMGGSGHLSNLQSLEAVLELERRRALDHIVLLHLSRQCNTPDLVRALYTQRAPHLLDRLTITSQVESTVMLHVRAAQFVGA